MKKEYIEGFVKRAQENGIDRETALGLVNKVANAPGAGLEGGMQAGGAAPDPSQVSPTQGAGACRGIPPEIEQLIDQLPPEVLAQLVQEIEQELSGAGGGAGAGHPGGGHPAHGGHPGGGHRGAAGGLPPEAAGAMMPPKQASAIAKEASYVEGFFGHAYELGFNKDEAKNLYKHALAIIEQQERGQVKSASELPKENQNAHFTGFMEKAAEYGLTQQQAYQVYVQTFGK